MPKKIAVHNLGCKVNSYELDVMQQRLKDKGYEIVPFDTEADVYIINTCTVTNIADRKSRQMLHKAKKENPEAIVVAVGCYVETDKAGVLKDESIDLAIGNNRKADIVDLLEEYIKEKESEEKVDKTLCGNSMVDINHTNEYEEMKLSQMPGHTRSYIKIQDGCNQFCSYCIIPFARGRIRSRQQQDIIEEVTTLAKDGCKEIVITGIHISSFGLDREGSELLELLQKLIYPVFVFSSVFPVFLVDKPLKI
jgi:threonylcarbamoyladenosine tRNA methylthiotransferase MtaB